MGSLSIRKRMPTIAVFLVVGLSLSVVGCSTVPPEVVELSYAIGNDSVAVSESYEALVHEYFGNLKDQRLEYLDDVWYPRFLENWIEDGRLKEIAAGDVIWAIDDSGFEEVNGTANAADTLRSLDAWVTYALYAYEVKESNLMSPLENEENELTASVRMAFDQIALANAHVTAHLNSLRKIQEVQDEMLAALELKELRDQINETLITVSQEAAQGLEEIKKADAIVTDLIDQVDQL